MKHYAHYNCPVGKLRITDNGEAIIGVEYITFSPEAPSDAVKVATPLIRMAIRQLNEYFDGNRTAFDVPLAPQGTEYQRRVWDALTRIPYGEMRSYKQTSIVLGNPNGARAVGRANNSNPISIIIPCHRVVGDDGRLVGYAGGLFNKEKLLEHEQSTLKALTGSQ